MGSVPFAFSVHQFVTSVGADAGFAAIIGLAILVLLYFAQARETAGLREQAYEAGQRVEQLEARVAQLMRQPAPEAAAAPAPPRVAARVAPNSVSAATAAPSSVPAGAAPAFLVGAPAGVAAPALTAATRLIPIESPRPAAVAAASGPPRGRAAVAEPPPAEPAGDATAVSSPAPATAAGAANGSARQWASSPPVAARAGAGSPPPVAARAGAGSPPPVPVRPGGEPPRSPVRPPGPGDGARRQFLPPAAAPRKRSRVVRVLAVLLALALAAAAVVVLLTVTSGPGAGNSPSTSARTTNAPASGRTPVAASFTPSKVTVAVLNGTATPGLAGRTSRRLAAAGYKPGMVATASDQTRTASIVAYVPGYRADAVHVAAALKLPPTAVQAIDQSAQAVACPPPAACTANVVVTTGSDLASS